jgi:hypothetical protein
VGFVKTFVIYVCSVPLVLEETLFVDDMRIGDILPIVGVYLGVPYSNVILFLFIAMAAGKELAYKLP